MKRYQYPKPVTYLLYIDWNFDIAKYPVIEAHLMQYEAELVARSEVKAKRYPWFALERPRMEIQQEFAKTKIVFPDIASAASYTIDTNGSYLSNTGYIIPLDDKFLLGILNSSIMDVFFRSLSNTIRGGYLRFIRQYVEQLPIPAATAAEQAAIAALVTQILAAKAADPAADTREAEAQVDALVAALYGVALPTPG